MQLTGKAVLILPKDLPEKIGNIHVPRTAKGKPMIGTVVKAGPLCLEIILGSDVFYLRKSSSVITIDEVEYHLLTIDQILAVIK